MLTADQARQLSDSYTIQDSDIQEIYNQIEHSAKMGLLSTGFRLRNLNLPIEKVIKHLESKGYALEVRYQSILIGWE